MSRRKKSPLARRIRRERTQQGLSQATLADKIGVSQAQVSYWERGKGEPNEKMMKALGRVLGTALTEGEEPGAGGPGPFAVWLIGERTERGLSVPELAGMAGVTPMTIYSLESGRSRNPQDKTRKRLEKALKANLPEDAAEEVEAEQTVEGVGAMQDFDPYDRDNLPKVPGIYVFYDVSDRPIYVGEGSQIARRIRDHEEKFWFKQPVVVNGSFIEVRDKTLRLQIERILIKFLKSNAVINKQNVER